MQHIAQEARCYVVSGKWLRGLVETALTPANQYQQASDFPEDYPAKDAPADAWSRGGSCIIGPLGEILAGPIWDKEGIITAEVGR